MRNCLLPGMTVEMCCLLACKLPTPCGGARLCEVYSAAARPARLEGLGRAVVRRPPTRRLGRRATAAVSYLSPYLFHAALRTGRRPRRLNSDAWAS